MYIACKNKHCFINIRPLLWGIFFTCLSGILLYILTLPGAEEEDYRVYAWILIAIFLVIALGFFVLFPHSCIVDEAGITIRYVLGLKEYAEWGQIRKIYLEYDDGRDTFRTRYLYYFVGMTGKKAFFMNSEFPKTRRLEKCLSQYVKVTLPTKFG